MTQPTEYIIYSTPSCHYCQLLKGWLSERGIPFQNKDVAGDLVARGEMVEKSQQLGVPVSVISFSDGREEVVVGFDQRRLDLLFAG